MAEADIQGVRIAGVASAVPRAVEEISDLAAIFGVDQTAKIIRNTGVERRHRSAGGLCASDLCCAAAQDLLHGLGWAPESVAGVIMVSQSFDFALPATSCILQHRLGLPVTAVAFDVGLGCSGYVYGVWVASSLMAASGLSRMLLLAGDMATRSISPRDRSTALLFGDAGTATALERRDGVPPLVFSLGTDGSGWRHLRLTGATASARCLTASTTGTEAAGELFMDGAEIFAFALREVPPLVARTLSAAGWSVADVNHCVFHQANRFALMHLAGRIGIDSARIPISLDEYGNTSSASIPLTMTVRLSEALRGDTQKLLLAGFGTGYSWGACALAAGGLVMPPLRLLDEEEAWRP